MMRRDARPFDLAEALARVPPVRRPALPVRLWHHRHGLLLGGGAPAALLALAAMLHVTVPIFLLVGLALVYVTTPGLRRWTVGRVRCARVPHELRATFRGGRICSADGRPPFVLWTSRTHCGVRVRLHCPIGMRPALLEESAGLIQAVCGADDVVVVYETGSRTVIIGLGYVPRGRWWER